MAAECPACGHENPDGAPACAETPSGSELNLGAVVEPASPRPSTRRRPKIVALLVIAAALAGLLALRLGPEAEPAFDLEAELHAVAAALAARPSPGRPPPHLDAATLARAEAMHVPFAPQAATLQAFLKAWLERTVALHPDLGEHLERHPHPHEITSYDPLSLARRHVLAREALAHLERRGETGLDAAIARLWLEAAVDEAAYPPDHLRLLHLRVGLNPLMRLALWDCCDAGDRQAAAAARLRAMAGVWAALPAQLDRPPPALLASSARMLTRHLEFVENYPAQWEAPGPELRAACASAASALRQLQAALSGPVAARADGPEGVGREVFERLLYFERLDSDVAALWAELRVDLSEAWADYARAGVVEDTRAEAPLVEMALYLERFRALSRGWLPLEADPGLTVMPAPSNLDREIGAAFYLAPQDGGAGRIAVSAAEWGRASLIHAVAHEGYPGHHLQHLAVRDLPATRRGFGSFFLLEGWARYAEDLLHEDGQCPVGDADASVRAVDRAMQSFDALLDVAWHTRAVSPDRLLAWYTAYFRTPVTLEEMAGRLAFPLLPAAYVAGRRDILRLRERGGLSPREFHRRLMTFGTLPPRLAAAYWDESAGAGR